MIEGLQVKNRSDKVNLLKYRIMSDIIKFSKEIKNEGDPLSLLFSILVLCIFLSLIIGSPLTKPIPFIIWTCILIICWYIKTNRIKKIKRKLV